MRYIDPKKIIRNRFLNEDLPDFDASILIFRDKFTSSLIKYNLSTKPLDKKILYGISPEHTHVLNYNNKNILVIEQLIWGGPQVSILIEELNCLNIKIVLGIGACGSISKKIKKGSIVINNKSIITDGTSKFYTDLNEIIISENINNKISEYIIKNNIPLVSSATIDALYQETEILINSFIDKEIDIINMESATFYSCSNYYNLEYLWIGCVSDSINDGEWDDWFDSKESTIRSAQVLNDIIKIIF
jgi:purine-nucleoside phosphorylase